MSVGRRGLTCPRTHVVSLWTGPSRVVMNSNLFNRILADSAGGAVENLNREHYFLLEVSVPIETIAVHRH